MYDEIEIKNRVLKTSEEMFSKFGFSKVKMDEIAAEVGISKKTLYKLFSGKEALLAAVLNKSKCEIDEFLDSVWNDNSLDFVAKLSAVMNYVGKYSTKLKEPLILELKKCSPHLWEELKEFRKQHVMERFTLLINEGVEAGVFKQNINKEIVVLMYLSAIQSIIDPEVLSGFSFSAHEAFASIINIVMEGILTPSGRIELYSQKNEIFNNSVKEI